MTRSPEERRANLLQWNSDADAAGLHCQGCPGTCCTFVANSVRMTPLEALDLQRHLVSTGRWNGQLWDKLRENTERFQLDRPEPGDGRRSFGRRRYTCPFFQETRLGCPLPREVKPYGCLGFHPFQPGASEGVGCASDADRLEVREGLDKQETTANQTLASLWGWKADKLPIPVALLTLVDLL